MELKSDTLDKDNGTYYCIERHNVDAYKEAKANLDNYGKHPVVGPPGIGKTYIAMEIMNDMREDLKVVIVPVSSIADSHRKTSIG